MFSTIFRYELSYWSRSPLPYIFGFFLFIISFITMWGMASEASTGPGMVVLNSYYSLNNKAGTFNLIMIFLLPAISGLSIYRDFSSRMHTVLYAYPFKRRDYLLAKFCSSFLVLLIIVSMIGFGFLLGTQMPGVKHEVLLAFDPLNYLQLYGVFIIPNLLLFGAIVFSLVLFTRDIYISFIGVAFMVIFQGIVGGIFTGENLQLIGSLLDPLGEKAIKGTIKYWTLEERNYQAIPLSVSIICNRIFWLSTTAFILFITYRKFQFSQFNNSLSRKKGTDRRATTPLLPKIQEIKLPSFQLEYRLSQRLRTVWNISNIDFKTIVWSWPFAAILIAGFLMVFFQQYQMNPQDGIALLSTTSEMLRIPMFIFTGVINLLTFLYAGVLIYRGKINRMDGLIDSVPQPNWVLVSSKFIAILKMQLLLMSMVMIGGIITQIFNGYYRFEILHYVFELFILQFIHFSIYAMLAFFVHTLVPNLYLGIFILILIPISIVLLPGVSDLLNIPALKESIILFNQVPGQFVGFDYSDFNGYGTILRSYFAYKFYWGLIGLTLLLLAILSWKRGLNFGIKERFSIIKSRFTGALRLGIFSSTLMSLILGGTIYYNEHFVSKSFYTQEDEEKVLFLNEQRYLKFMGMAQPRICAAEIQMDIFPKSRDFKASGQLYFINKSNTIIDTILIAKSFREITKCQTLNPHEILTIDEELHFEIHRLTNGLNKGDTLHIQFDISNHPNSYFHHDSRALQNGTYLTSNILPTLGVRNAFLKGQKKRAKYGLGKEKNKALIPTDTSLLGYNFSGNNMDRINYESIVSTSIDQEVFSMGTLKKRWTENNRNYFHFKSDGQITNNISWISGSYEKKQDSGQHQHLELYHRKNHDQNLNYFFQGLSASLDYCSKWFGPLAYDTLKMVEFPITYGTYATLNGNLIPYSESQFLCNVKDHKNENFNFPFYTSAHEIAHYWWGHRVDPANVQGGKLLTESMAEYLATKVTEYQYGYQEALEHRKRFMDVYFRIRAESKGELPLVNAKLNQDHINYQKGGLALYTLSEFITEDSLNHLLANYEKAKRYTEPPYPTSLDFMEHISAGVPDSLKYLVKDLFETITIHENKIENVALTKIEDTYLVDLNITLTKHRANGEGKRSFSDNGIDSLSYDNQYSLPLQDYFQIGIYDSNEKLLKQIDFRADAIQQNFKISLKDKPAKIILDPNILCLDADRVDNEWNLE